LGEDRLDITPGARVDDDRVITIVDELDMAIEGIGQVEPPLPAPDQFDVFRQFHDGVLPSPSSCPHLNPDALQRIASSIQPYTHR